MRPLTALAASEQPNGRYIYGPRGTFPNATYQNTNYWVDPIFQPSAPTPSPTPGVCQANGFGFTSSGTTIQSGVVRLITQAQYQALPAAETQELRDMLIMPPQNPGPNDNNLIYLLEAPTINAKRTGVSFIWSNFLRVYQRVEFSQTVGSIGDKQIWYQVSDSSLSTAAQGWIPVRYDGRNYLDQLDPCLGLVPTPSSLTFPYDRRAAANYAIEHSYDTAVNHGLLQNTQQRVTQSATLFTIPPRSIIPYAYFRYTGFGLGTIGQNGERITGSALFVSESQWMGGMPMTWGERGNGSQDSCLTAGGATKGWRYCFTSPDPGFVNEQTSNPFDTHGDLSAYWTSAGVLQGSPIGGGFTIQGGQFSSLFPYVIVGRATTANNDPNNGGLLTRQTDLNPPGGPTLINLGGGIVNDRPALSTRLILLLNQNLNNQQPPNRLKMGDYITMIRPLNDNTNLLGDPGSVPFHGLMVIGWQEALDCEAAVFQDSNRNSFKIWTVNQFAETHIPGSTTIALNGTPITNPVPWVVDFTAPPVYNNGNPPETQNPVPRPFYCTMYRDYQLGAGPRPVPIQDFFSAHDWQFFTLPDQVVVSTQANVLNQLYVNPAWGW